MVRRVLTAVPLPKMHEASDEPVMSVMTTTIDGLYIRWRCITGARDTARPFYNARHTFISVALTLGCNQKWLAEQTGISIAMLQQSYGEFIRDDGDALLKLYRNLLG